MAQNANLVQASGLAVGYGGRPIVRGIELSLSSGQLLAIVGHNGSGKSSLIKTLLGQIAPVSGTLELTRPKPQIAYLGQRQHLDRHFPMRAIDLVASGGWDMGAFSGLFRFGKRASSLHGAASRAMQMVGLTASSMLPLAALSGGQLQRALFARAIVQDAPLMVLDEPFAGVDQKTESDLLAIILGWVAEGRGVILVSHDLNSVLNHANKALLLGGGGAIFGDPCIVLSPKHLVTYAYMSKAQHDWMAGMYGAGRHNRDRANL